MRGRIDTIKAAALAALTLGSISCNFMMPTANYPVIRQEKELILLENYRMPYYDRVDGVRLGFAALDGASSLTGAGSPIVYLSIRNRYQNEGQIIFLAPGFSIPLDRGGVGFNERLISIDNGTGFLTENGGALVRIDRDGGSLRSTPLGPTLDNIETAAATGELRGFSGNIFPANVYRAFFDNGTDLFTRFTNALPNTTPLAIFIGGRNTVAGSFTTLTDAAYPDSVFWNPGGYEIRRFGFSELGAFSWFEAVRLDNVRKIEEAKLVALRDNGTIRIGDYTSAGSAGGYVLAWKNRKAPGFRLSVLDNNLDEIHAFSVYGYDVAYLGEAMIALPSGMVQSAIFATLGPIRNDTVGGNMVSISIYAYPVSLLDGSAP